MGEFWLPSAWHPSQNRDLLENCFKDFNYVSVVYGDRRPKWSCIGDILRTQGSAHCGSRCLCNLNVPNKCVYTNRQILARRTRTDFLFQENIVEVNRICKVLALISRLLFVLKKLDLWDHLAVCVSVCLCIPSYQCLNAWSNLYETWYVYYGTWAHLSGVLHKSLPSVCVLVSVSSSFVAGYFLIYVVLTRKYFDCEKSISRLWRIYTSDPPPPSPAPNQKNMLFGMQPVYLDDCV
jgi:hypothetical protein